MGATRERKQRLMEQLGGLRFQHLQLTDPDLVGAFYSRSNQQATLELFKAFTDLSNGQPYTRSDFKKLATTAEARNAFARRTTLQRAAIGHTFMGATSERKRSLIRELGGLRFQHLQLTEQQLKAVTTSAKAMP